jgi:hypothetical protein
MVNAMIVIHVIYFTNALPVNSHSRVLKRLMIIQMTNKLPASFSISYLFFLDMKSHQWGTGSTFQGNILEASLRVEMSKKNSAQQVDVCIHRDGVTSSPTSSWTFQHLKMDHYTVSKCWVRITL